MTDSDAESYRTLPRGAAPATPAAHLYENSQEDDRSQDIVDKISLLSNPTSEDNSIVRYWSTHTLSIALHVCFVLLHVVLIIVMCLGAEKKVHVPWGYWTTFWTTGIQFILQTFAIGYLAIALFAAQKLFMQRILASPQTLTTSHDQYISWLGLGGALSSLYKQRSTASATRSLVLIAVYMAASAAVKVTTSTLFQLSPVYLPGEIQATATSMQPKGPRGLIDGEASGKIIDLQAKIMELVNQNATSFVSTVGMDGNTLYDVIPVTANATGTVEVNTYRINVTCQMVDYDLWKKNYPFKYVSRRLILFPGTVRYHWLQAQNSPGNTSTFIIPLMTFLNISDSQGVYLKRYPLSSVHFLYESYTYDAFYEFILAEDRGPQSSCSSLYAYLYPRGPTTIRQGFRGVVDTVQLSACGIEVVTGKSQVDAQRRTLVDPPIRKVSSSWSVYPGSAPDPSKWSASDEGYPDSGILFGKPGNTGQVLQRWGCMGNVTDSQTGFNSGTQDSSFFETFAFQRMGLYGSSDSGAQQEGLPSTTLHEIENILEDYVTMSFFASQKANNTAQIEALASEQASVTIPQMILMSQLTLRPLPVFLGSGAALVMLAVVIWIALTTHLIHSPPNDLGLLQILWLSDVNLGPVVRPTENKLRRAGNEITVVLQDGLGTMRKRDKPLEEVSSQSGKSRISDEI
ncbi:hypothetical protein DL96DRAFT_1641930 [Flagelloscypha sp. PMI_526]|nr:hypothetical protein DL96DRAFT_1641930 [Flagelloscypha sp. PMI_526]